MSSREWAEHYLSLGWVPIPIAHGQKAPLRSSWEGTTIDSASGRLKKDFPDRIDTNIGIVLGAPSGGLVDIDLDCPEANELAAMVLPPTAIFGRSSTPQAHYLYRCPAVSTERFLDPLRTGKDTKRTLLEIRSTGGQTVFPGSTHPSGELIEWATADDVQAIPIEAGMLRLLAARLAGAVLLARYWPDGGRHDCQLALAGALLTDGWDEDDTIALLTAIGGDEEKRRATVERTSTLLKEGQHVTGWAQLKEHFDPKLLARVKKWFDTRVSGEVDHSELAPDTDIANARRLVAMHGRDIRYVVKWDKWLVWDGKRWAEDDIGVRRRAEGTVLALYQQANDVAKAGDIEYSKHLRKWARACSNPGAIGALLKQAQVQPGIAVRPEELDGERHWFNCGNGTVDLRTGEVVPWDRSHLLTKLCPVNYDPDADSPLWERTVLEIMGGDDELAFFVQLAMGYTLSGKVDRDLMFLCHGNGANGKSTLLRTLQETLGTDYAGQMLPEVLLSSAHDKHPTAIASLAGKRFVTCSEADAGRSLAEGAIKSLTGSDMVTARRMREDLWEFSPSHVLWFACNHLPNVKGTDLGIWRRIILLPFAVTFETPDLGLRARLLREREGILSWILAGSIYLDSEPSSFVLPACARVAKSMYQSDQDRLREFLDECTEPDRDSVVEFAIINDVYRAWCDDNGETPIYRNTFSRMLDERGFTAAFGSEGRKSKRGLRMKGARAGVMAAMRRNS